MRKILLLAILLSFHSLALAQGLQLPSNSIAITDNVLSVISNPALLGARPGAEMMLIFPYSDDTFNEDRGLLLKFGSLGFGAEFAQNDSFSFNRYTLSSGHELAKGIYFGGGYSWYRAQDWEGSWNAGFGFRPLPFVSFGAVANDFNRPDRDGSVLEPSYGMALALRPFGWRYTLSADLLLTKAEDHDYGDNLDPLLRLEAQPMDGIRLIGEYRTDSEFFGLGFSLAVDRVAAGTFRRMDDFGSHLQSVGHIHLTSAVQQNMFSPPPHQIVEIKLDGEIRESEPPFSFFGGENAKTLHQLLREIQHYADDPLVDGLLINFQNPRMGLAQAQQLRRSLEEFKDTGKRLIAFSETYSQRSYYLATVCDEIYLLPVGDLDLKGLAAVMGYWKGTLDKLGIGIQVVRVRDYKTAVNAFIFEEPTQAEAEMINWLLDDIYGQICDKIAVGRNWTVEEVKSKVDGGPYTAKWAMDEGLVDSLKYYDELTKELKGEKFHLVSERSYWSRGDYSEEWPDLRNPRVAVIYAEGTIVSGESGQNFLTGSYMGSETIAKAISKAREDKSIDAIILRVDSPGGSGLASNVIYREVRRITEDEEHRKPIIVSMGNVAASGGYYISCAADTIIAEEGTITGSIGGFAIKPNLQGLHKKIRYNTSTFKRGQHADAYSLSRPFTDEEMEILKQAIEEFYGDFIGKVADGRGLEEASVDSIGEGRVWTGQQAKDRGLVDLIGGMDLAFEVVRAQLGEAEGAALDLQFFPEHHGFFANVAQGLAQIGHKPLPEAVNEILEPLYMIAVFNEGEPLLLMPYEIETK
ncbi:MAG TPA: signal peptide peptidase SppA [bacterium]|jgi:protease-4